MIYDSARKTGNFCVKDLSNSNTIACSPCLEPTCFARHSHQIGVVQSYLQKSGRIRCNPTLSGFSGWIEGHGCSMPRRFSLKIRRSGEADCHSRLLQVALQSFLKGVLVIAVFLLTACSVEEKAWSPPSQQWQNMSIHVETRPAVIREGMNEFLIIADRQQRGFSSDLMVDVRTDHSNWKQAMPDGALGVFRRALPVKDVQHDHLYVRLVRKGQQREMMFSLAQTAGATKP